MAARCVPPPMRTRTCTGRCAAEAGNFGVVTEFEFELHEQGTMLAGRVVDPATEAADLLRFYRRFVAAAPDELTVSAGLLHTPDGTPAVAVVPVYSGDDLGEGDDEPNVVWGADEVWRPVHPHSTGIYVNTLGSDSASSSSATPTVPTTTAWRGSKRTTTRRTSSG